MSARRRRCVSCLRGGGCVRLTAAWRRAGSCDDRAGDLQLSDFAGLRWRWWRVRLRHADCSNQGVGLRASTAIPHRLPKWHVYPNGAERAVRRIFRRAGAAGSGILRNRAKTKSEERSLDCARDDTQRCRPVRFQDSGGVHRTPETGEASGTKGRRAGRDALRFSG